MYLVRAITKYTSTVHGKWLFILLPILFYTACKNSTAYKYGKDEANFKTYYVSHFHKNPDYKDNYYLLLSENGCHGCIEGLLKTLTNDKRTTIIMSPKGYATLTTAYTGENIIIDSTGDINRLVYTRDNVGIIVAKGGHITNILNPEINDIPKVIDSLLH